MNKFPKILKILFRQSYSNDSAVTEMTGLNLYDCDLVESGAMPEVVHHAITSWLPHQRQWCEEESINGACP